MAYMFDSERLHCDSLLTFGPYLGSITYPQIQIEGLPLRLSRLVHRLPQDIHADPAMVPR